MKKHVEHIHLMLNCLKKRDLRLKLEKYEFHKDKINYLDFTVDRNEISIDFDKVRIVKK